MNKRNVKLRNVLTIASIVAVGAGLQIVLWKTNQNTVGEALLKHSYLWVVYLLAGVFLAEHGLNLLRRRR